MRQRLSSLAAKAGFGNIADIRAVRSDGDPTAVAYLTKQLADDLVGYLARGSISGGCSGDHRNGREAPPGPAAQTRGVGIRVGSRRRRERL